MLGEATLDLREEGEVVAPRRLVASYGETLYPNVRALLEDTFRARGVDLYNCEEVGNVAWECPSDSTTLHVNPSTCRVEILDDDGEWAPAGAVGDVVITNLCNWTMPQISYKTGDRAAFRGDEMCVCGQRERSIQLVEGRDEDFWVLGDGRAISPRLAYEVVHEALPLATQGTDFVQAIRAFQAIQRMTSMVEVRVVPGPRYGRELWRDLDENLRRRHPDLRGKIVEVESLAEGTGGTFRQIRSDVPSPWRT